MNNFEVMLEAVGNDYVQQIFFRCFAQDWNDAAIKALEQFPDRDVIYMVKSIVVLDYE